MKYVTRLVRAKRPGDPLAPEAVREWIHCGADPRATQYLLLAAKAGAVMRGSLVVECNDVRLAALPVLRLRMFTNLAADSKGVDVDEIISNRRDAARLALYRARWDLRCARKIEAHREAGQDSVMARPKTELFRKSADNRCKVPGPHGQFCPLGIPHETSTGF